jgi:N-acetylmuramoyl-L-alanine amidase
MGLSGGSGRLGSASRRQNHAGSRGKALLVRPRAITGHLDIYKKIHLAARWSVTVMISLIALAVLPRPLLAAVITAATVEHQESVTELHFAIKGRGLGWHLTTHGQELWIDLNHVRMELPPGPLAGNDQPPIAGVHTLDGGGGTARIVVEVIGRADYAVAREPHELVLRVAPAGASGDLAAPFAARTERRQRQIEQPPVDANSRVAEPGVVVQPGNASYRTSDDRQQMPKPAAERRQIAAALVPGVAAASMLPGQTRNPEPASFSITHHADTSVTAPAALPSPAFAIANGATPLVVIDPGHGGHDPGTAATDGTAEKDVALAIALRLCAALKAQGIRAEMTRGDDTFLALGERTALANQAGADLFVSIHLNSSPDTATSGIETYYLNNTTDHATMRLARMENGVAGGYSLSGSPDLNYILTDMRQQYKANESASLAGMIEAEAAASAETSMGLQLNALGAKQGPFYVLVGAMMPAVLVECGFLSNTGEAQLLEAPRYQQALADGIAHAVGHYFNADAAVGNL